MISERLTIVDCELLGHGDLVFLSPKLAAQTPYVMFSG